jgi:hypothetical protein
LSQAPLQGGGEIIEERGNKYKKIYRYNVSTVEEDTDWRKRWGKL